MTDVVIYALLFFDAGVVDPILMYIIVPYRYACFIRIDSNIGIGIDDIVDECYSLLILLNSYSTIIIYDYIVIYLGVIPPSPDLDAWIIVMVINQILIDF